MKIFLILIITFFSSNLIAQVVDNIGIEQNDSLRVVRSLEDQSNALELEMVEPEHDPNKAALYSAAVPGLGQAYNRKYWKIPIVWGGLAAFGYFINWNNNQYQYFRRNLIFEIAQDPNFPNETGLNASVLKSARDSYRRSRDQLVLYGILFYLLNIVDAHIDAHLMEFSVNQDLSVQISPEIFPQNNVEKLPAGMSIKIKF